MSIIKKHKDIQCINCGGHGHTSKHCNCPTTSFGIICFKMIKGALYYIMIQRKDSMSYVEFVRGNYNIRNKNYIIHLFERMTDKEREFLKNNTFTGVWNNLWVDNHRNNSFYKTTKEKFNMMKNGYYVKNQTGNKILFGIDYILEMHPSIVTEQEWEFPKGRRKLGEKDFQCAIREFSEESGIKSRELIFGDTSKYFEEVYLSTNKLRYRTVYFIAKHYSNMYQNKPLFDTNDIHQAKEVRDVKWLSHTEVHEKLKTRSSEKHEMFKLVNDYISKKLS